MKLILPSTICSFVINGSGQKKKDYKMINNWTLNMKSDKMILKRPFSIQ